MGAYPTALAASGVDRTSPDSLSAFDSERDLLRLAHRLRLALPAVQLPSLAVANDPIEWVRFRASISCL
jgi:hypothetical protein